RWIEQSALNPTAFRKRNVLSAPNDKMIKHTDVHELAAFYYALSDEFIRFARLCTPRRMIMCKDHRRSIDFYRFTNNFTRMNLNVAQRAGKEAAMFNHFMLRVEENNHKNFTRLHRKLTLQKGARQFRAEQRVRALH